MIEDGDIAVLQFSGGRDSIATLLYCKPYLDRITVMFLDTGSVMPEVEKTIEWARTISPNFVRVQTDSASVIEQYGIPSDIVPVWKSGIGAEVSSCESQRVISSLDCCWHNLIKPMQDASERMGATLIIRGQRKAERMKSPASSGYQLNGIRLWFPLEDWSDIEVNGYLAEHGIELPEWYKYGDKGFDCWHCSGFVSESQGLHKYLALHHPEKWEVVRKRLDYIKSLAIEYVEMDHARPI